MSALDVASLSSRLRQPTRVIGLDWTMASELGTVLTVLYVLVLVCAVLGNCLSLIFLFMHRRSRVLSHFWLQNYCVLDLLLILFCLVPNMQGLQLIALRMWTFGWISWIFYGFILHLVPSITAGMLTLSIAEHFIPMFTDDATISRRVHFSSKRLVIYTMLAWLAGVLLGAPFFISSILYPHWAADREIPPQIGLQYFEQVYRKSAVDPYPATLFPWFVLPLSTLLICCCKMGMDKALTFCSHRKDLNFIENSESVYSTMCCCKEDGRLLTALTILFSLMSAPHHIRSVWFIVDMPTIDNQSNDLLKLVTPGTFLLLFWYSAIKPLVYIILSPRYRRMIWDVIRLKNIVHLRGSGDDTNRSVMNGGRPLLSIELLHMHNNNDDTGTETMMHNHNDDDDV